MAVRSILGIDIGVNTVGSCWVEPEEQKVHMGVSVFPAGVEDSYGKRGKPKNQIRRMLRNRRKSIDRIARARVELRKFLQEKRWMPSDGTSLIEWECHERYNPWLLRKKGLTEPLEPFEFGKILLHLLNSRGPSWTEYLDEDEINKEDKSFQLRIQATKEHMKIFKYETFGELMAVKYNERKMSNTDGRFYSRKIRNRANALGELEVEYFADRQMVLSEFLKLWDSQKKFDSQLAPQLTIECKEKFYNNRKTHTWKCQGLIFGQRKMYWNVKTIGRCELEPTDRCCPEIDMYAQEFILLQIINKIRINESGELPRKLSEDQKLQVLSVLRKQKTASQLTIRKAIGLNKLENKFNYTLSTDELKSIDTSWFYREVVLNAIGEDCWKNLDNRIMNSINNAILKLQPDTESDRKKFKKGCEHWWSLRSKQSKKLYEVWLKRPDPDKKIDLSQKAIRNLLPYMRKGSSLNEARQLFAEDANNQATDIQRQRYSLKKNLPSRNVRNYMKRYPDRLPPAPENISNPVVRKTIYEVRRHLLEQIRLHGCKPDNVVIQLAREARQTAKKISDKFIKDAAIDRYKQVLRKRFQKYFEGIFQSQENYVYDKIRLCYQQKETCAYCESHISLTDAAGSDNLLIDYIIPRSRGGSDSLSNKVLCHFTCNKGKKNMTPIEWLNRNDFEKMEQKFKHLRENRPFDNINPDMYDKRKWGYLHTHVKDLESYVQSQLFDTFYTEQQIAQWLRDVLYDGEKDGQRRVFTTNRKHTKLLRNAWGLDFSEKKEEDNISKTKADYRYHAIESLVIALTGPKQIRQIANIWEKYEIEQSEKTKEDKKEIIEVPWGDKISFCDQIKELYDKIIISHNPQRRKLVGALHNDTLYGFIPECKNKYVISICVIDLKSNHLRVSEKWLQLSQQYNLCQNLLEKRIIRKQMLNTEDINPSTSGIVKDRWLREQIRQCLLQNELDPDGFSKLQIKNLIENGKFKINGAPIRHVRILRPLYGIKIIHRKNYNPRTWKKEYLSLQTKKERKSQRVYKINNNHHIEIRDKNGKWGGYVVNNFEAAERLRPSKASGKKTEPAVNRNDNENGKFIMSLSIGEIIKMKHPESGEPGYFVVIQIGSRNKINFIKHNDAGRAKATEMFIAREELYKSGNKQGGLSLSEIQNLGLEPGKPPVKVWVSPLGKIKELYRD